MFRQFTLKLRKLQKQKFKATISGIIYRLDNQMKPSFQGAQFSQREMSQSCWFNILKHKPAEHPYSLEIQLGPIAKQNNRNIGSMLTGGNVLSQRRRDLFLLLISLPKFGQDREKIRLFGTSRYDYLWLHRGRTLMHAPGIDNPPIYWRNARNTLGD